MIIVVAIVSLTPYKVIVFQVDTDPEAYYYTLKAFHSQTVWFRYQNVSFRSKSVPFRPQNIRSVQIVKIVSCKAICPKSSEVFGNFHCHYQNGELMLKSKAHFIYLENNFLNHI